MDKSSYLMRLAMGSIAAIAITFVLGILVMWMNGFIGSMALLVLSNNLLFVFIGWKLVGICSYGLIGFYYKDQRKYWIGGPPPTEYVTPSQASFLSLIHI